MLPYVSCPNENGEFTFTVNNESFRYYSHTNLCILINCLCIKHNLFYGTLDEAFHNVMQKIPLQNLIEDFIEFKAIYYTYCRIKFPFVINIFCSTYDKQINDTQPIFTILRNNNIYLIYSKKKLTELFEKIAAYQFLFKNMNSSVMDVDKSQMSSHNKKNDEENKIKKLYHILDEAAFKAKQKTPIAATRKNAVCFDPLMDASMMRPFGTMPFKKSLQENMMHISTTRWKEQSNQAKLNIMCQTNADDVYNRDNNEKLIYMTIFINIIENSFKTIIQTLSKIPIKQQCIHIHFSNGKYSDFIARHMYQFQQTTNAKCSNDNDDDDVY